MRAAVIVPRAQVPFATLLMRLAAGEGAPRRPRAESAPATGARRPAPKLESAPAPGVATRPDHRREARGVRALRGARPRLPRRTKRFRFRTRRSAPARSRDR